MCTHVRQNFWKVSSNSEHHGKPTMNINSQHHNLLGNQIQSKLEDFCIWWPYNTLVTMAMAAILNLCNPKSCHILRWIFLQIFMKFDERNTFFFLNPPFSFPWQLRQSLSNRFRFFWLISFPNHGYQFRVKLNFAPKNSQTFHPELSRFTVSSIFEMTSRCR